MQSPSPKSEATSKCPNDIIIMPHSQWLPQPIFLIYRLALLIYVLTSLILNIVDRADRVGEHWPIFLTNIGYSTLVLATCASAILCLVYTIVHCKQKQWLYKYFPKMDSPLASIYSQDNIPCVVKIMWCLYIIGGTLAFIIFAGYWGCYVTQSGRASGANSSSVFCNSPDFHSVQVHGLNFLVVLIDLFISRIPFQLLHFLYPTSFIFAYVVFSLIYWRAGGVNHNGDPYIYFVLDYGSDPDNGGVAVVLILTSAIIYGVLFLIAWLRDVIFKTVGRYLVQRAEKASKRQKH